MFLVLFCFHVVISRWCPSGLCQEVAAHSERLPGVSSTFSFLHKDREVGLKPVVSSGDLWWRRRKVRCGPDVWRNVRWRRWRRRGLQGLSPGVDTLSAVETALMAESSAVRRLVHENRLTWAHLRTTEDSLFSEKTTTTLTFIGKNFWPL